MNKLLFTITLSLLLTICKAQTNERGPVLKADDYLKKAKGQNTAGWVLAGTGIALVTAGASIGFSEAMISLGNIFSFEEPEPSSNTGEVLFYSGLVLAAGSIPFFIAAGKNKKEARRFSASLKIEDRWQWQQQGKIKQFYPALSLRVPLSKK